MYDKSNALKNLTSNQSETTATTVIAKEGIVKDRKMFLFDGSIITTNRNNGENDIVKFEQINIDLKNLKTGTIKQFKFQETSSINLVNCIINPSAIIINCNENVNSEIITVLNRRFFLPFLRRCYLCFVSSVVKSLDLVRNVLTVMRKRNNIK